MPQIQFNKDRTFDDAEIYFWHIAESCNELSELIADNGALLAEAQKRFKSVTSYELQVISDLFWFRMVLVARSYSLVIRSSSLAPNPR